MEIVSAREFAAEVGDEAGKSALAHFPVRRQDHHPGVLSRGWRRCADSQAQGFFPRQRPGTRARGPRGLDRRRTAAHPGEVRFGIVKTYVRHTRLDSIRPTASLRSLLDPTRRIGAGAGGVQVNTRNTSGLMPLRTMRANLVGLARGCSANHWNPGYPIEYSGRMVAPNVIEQAREAAGLSQEALARRAGTSRPTISAYEHERKSPSLATAVRIIAAAGFDLTITPHIEFREVATARGRSLKVPNVLPRLPVAQAFATVELPLHLNWSDRGRRYDLRDRRRRARVYEIVLREGSPDDVLAYVDGALLIDLWDDLVLPAATRAAWQPLVTGENIVQVA